MLLDIVCICMGIVATVSTLKGYPEYATVALLFAIYFRVVEIRIK